MEMLLPVYKLECGNDSYLAIQDIHVFTLHSHHK